MRFKGTHKYVRERERARARERERERERERFRAPKSIRVAYLDGREHVY
jgi:hypothetical protein